MLYKCVFTYQNIHFKTNRPYIYLFFMSLISAQTLCHDGSQVYFAGDSFPSSDGCNTCGCLDSGFIVCTKIACLAVPW